MSLVTVWHDGDCPLCQREIAMVRQLDTRDVIRFVDLTSADPCPLDKAVMLARFHARQDDGPLLSGAAAFGAMWRAIPVLLPLGEAARSRLVLSLLDRVYIGFRRIRPPLQRWPASGRYGHEAEARSRRSWPGKRVGVPAPGGRRA